MPLSGAPWVALFGFTLITLGLARLISEEWTVSEKTIAPDGVYKTVPLVNGIYPGPTLRGHVGDNVRIILHNNYTEAISLHWHGIKQQGTVWSDGVPGVTQCAVAPGQMFVYTFLLDTPGTLWWHSHSDFQKSSMQGALIVDGDQDIVGEHPEHTMILNDWFHISGKEQIEGLLQPPESFVWVGDAQSLHFNGKGDFDCAQTNLTCNANAPDKGPSVFDVEPNSTYRLRIIGSSSISYMNLNIDNHSLSVIEAETTLVEPFETEYLDVATGQSYSVLLRTKSIEELDAIEDNNGLFWIQVNVRHEDTGERGLAVLRYSRNSGVVTPIRSPPAWPARHDLDWSLEHARNFKSRSPVSLSEPTRTLTVLGSNAFTPNGFGGWAINNISLELPSIPLIHQLHFNMSEEMSQWLSQPTIPLAYDYRKVVTDIGISPLSLAGVHVEEFQKDEVVDIVFQNAVNLGGFDQLHPWHLHLHNMWVLGYGNPNETWTPEMSSRYDTTTPVYRNTFNLYPGGWTAVRIKFDNPGFAHFHCHILAHLVTGMGFVAQVGTRKDLPLPTHFSQMCPHEVFRNL